MESWVLLIGENRGVVSMTERLLERNGYFVLPAVGLREGKQILRQKMPSLVVMNCELPDGSGIMACREVRQQQLPVKILLTSNELSDEVYALNAGADDFVKKPCHMDVLLARMRRLQPSV